MLDYTLRECPFCGNPAEIYDAEPFSWCPNWPTKGIRCSNEFGCPGHSITNLRYHPDSKSMEADKRACWNQRKRKNRNTWDRREETGGEDE